jgi:hypothetical protein
LEAWVRQLLAQGFPIFASGGRWLRAAVALGVEEEASRILPIPTNMGSA